jgi:hypothetical protein
MLSVPRIYFVLTLLSFLLTGQFIYGQTGKTAKRSTVAPDSTDDYFNENYLRYDNHTYKKNIKTVQLNNKAAEMSSPMMRLNSDDQLKLGFDDLDGGFKTYNYTVVHCNADWKPSDLVFNEFANGFSENPLNDYSYSAGLTWQKYTHYQLYLPNENLKISLSGNYLLKVYQDGKPEDLVLTRRFMVYDNTIFITPSFKFPGALTDKLTKQGVNFSIDYENNVISNPGDVKIMVMQNERWDNALTNIQPTFLKDRQLVYDFTDEQNEFNGGSEFRNFDMKSIIYHSGRMARVTKEDGLTHVYLTNDEKRSRERYAFSNDLDGRFLVKITEGTNSDVEADYCYVHFFLPYAAPETEANVYLLGGLTDWQFNSTSKMTYDYDRHGYACTLFLKQGFYDYEYVLLSDGQEKADETPIEGSHAETENDYTVFVYYRPPAMSYDLLLGAKRINTLKK